MYHIEGYELLIYGLSLLSVILLGNFSAKTVKPKLSQNKFLIVKKICLGVFILTSIYWIITFPYAGSYYRFSEEADYPNKVEVEQQSDYIVKNHRQIESLERELEQTKNELQAVTGRIQLILQLIMYGLIYFGASWIFTSNNRDTGEQPDNSSFDLQKIK